MDFGFGFVFFLLDFGVCQEVVAVVLDVVAVVVVGAPIIVAARFVNFERRRC
jgi:hypothetical protein